MDRTGNAAMAFGLKQRRKTMGYSQQQLADLLKMSRPTLVGLEQGQRSLTANELTALAEIFGCTEQDLIDGAPVDEEEMQLQAGEFWGALIEEARLLRSHQRTQVLDFVRFLRARG